MNIIVVHIAGMKYMIRNEIPKVCVTAVCVMLTVGLIISGIECEHNVDSPSAFVIGRWLLWLSSATAGATCAYSGIHCLNFWNETVANKEKQRLYGENFDIEANFFDSNSDDDFLVESKKCDC